MKWPIGRKVALGFGPLLSALVLIGVVGRLNDQYEIESRLQVEHTMRVLEHLHRLAARMSELEAAQRSYLITGLPEYLYTFREGKQLLGSDFTALRDLTRHNPLGVQRLSQAESLARVRLDAFDDTLKVREEKGLAAARRQVIQGPGRQVLGELRSVPNGLVSATSSPLPARERESPRRTRQSGGIALLLMMVA
ncbi:MAG: CHASE3 domain-containing protein, partial [Bryobacteraceae bacterium]